MQFHKLMVQLMGVSLEYHTLLIQLDFGQLLLWNFVNNISVVFPAIHYQDYFSCEIEIKYNHWLGQYLSWKNKVFHHRTHLRKTLFVFKIWSDLSTPFINALYLWIAIVCFTSTVSYLSLILISRFTVTYSFATSIEDNIVTILLSFHCKANKEPLLSHLMSPFSFFLPQTFPPFMQSGKSFRFSAVVPHDGVLCWYKSFIIAGEV